jgi:hypothetical protein
MNVFEQRAEYLKALSGLEELAGIPGGSTPTGEAPENEARR